MLAEAVLSANRIGYKLHIDAGDGGIPLSCILTSASVNDSQVAIPLATMNLMDAAYDAAEIRAHSESLGCADHRMSIRATPQELKQEAKAKRTLGHTPRMCATGSGRRVNGRLKDEFGARQVRVRGHSKVPTCLGQATETTLSGEGRN